MVTKEMRKVRGEHCLNIYVSFEFKEKIKAMARHYDQTMADMIRSILRIGIPVMEGISVAEEEMVKEYIKLFHKFRKMNSLKEI
jgi:predicted DNA-binding protein